MLKRNLNKEDVEAMAFRWEFHSRNHHHHGLLGHDWGPRICPDCIVREQHIKRMEKAEADSDDD